MPGAALVQYFKLRGVGNILSESICGVDLSNQNRLHSFFKKEKPEYVFLTHLKSGGIVANMKYPADFIYNNLQIQTNVIHYSYKFGVKRLVFLGSSCAYPIDSPSPLKEEYLFSGSLEKTSEMYAVAKIAGMKMCQAYSRQYGVSYTSLIPATIYGPGDDFDPDNSHVIPSLIKKFHEAKINNSAKAAVYGTGKQFREFIYVGDMVNACLFLMDRHDIPEIINIGCGHEVQIKKLAELIRDIVGFKGELIFDKSKPEGSLQKLLDSGKMTALGWKAKTPLKEGIRQTYSWYRKYVK